MTTFTQHRSPRNGAFRAGVLLFLAVLGALPILASRAVPAQQTTRHKPRPAVTAPAKRPPDAPTAFRVGETLNYKVAWAAFSYAASLQLSVVERRNLFGWSTWHFRAYAHTESPVRSLFAIDDQFDSYTDAATFESRQYEMYLNEMGRKESKVVRMLRSGERSQAPGPAVVVLPGTRDPLDTLYALRGVDWKTTPEVRAPVFDGHDVYEMRAKVDGPGESIRVSAGAFSCSRISIQVFEYQKEVPGISFVVWLANNAAHTPVEIQADLPFGSVRLELSPSSP